MDRSDQDPPQNKRARGEIVSLPTRPPSPPGAPERDVTDAALTQLAQRAFLPSGTPPHPDEETIIQHLRRALPEAQRLGLIQHLAGCSECCDRLELAAELLRVEPLHTGATSSTTPRPPPMLFDIGRALMQLDVAVEPACLRVLASDAEVRLGRRAVLRRPRQSSGVAFQRRLDIGHLQLTLLGARSGGLHLSLELEGAPVNSRASLLVAGRLVATEPLRHGQALFREVPIRTVHVRLEAPGQTLGHVRLTLRRCDSTTGEEEEA